MRLLIAFTFLLGAFILIGRAALDQSETGSRTRVSAPQTVPASFVRSDVQASYLAKREKLLWVESPAGQGFAFDLLSSPEAFQSLFPGYPDEMRKDRDLWGHYFRRSFEPDSYLNGMQKWFGPDFRIVYSWSGCMDIYSRYGADVIVIGTSETFRGIIPDLLADRLKTGDALPRVLMCAGGALPVQTVTRLAEMLQNARDEKPKTIVWGFSFWSAYLEGQLNRLFLKNKTQELDNYERSQVQARGSWLDWLEHYGEIALSDLVPLPDWSFFWPVSYQEMKASQAEENLQKRTSAQGSGKQKGGFISRALLSEPKAMALDIETRMRPYYRTFDDFDKRHCEISSKKETIQDAIRALKRLTPDLFVYLAPTTPLHTGSVDPCFHETVRTVLNQVATEEGFRLRTDDWNGFGLDYSHFLRVTRSPEVFRVDINHVNLKGATRITETIAAWIKKAHEGERK